MIKKIVIAQGVNYPRSYVRWTEGRNMAEFVRLIETRNLDIASCITHEFRINDALQAYESLEKNPGSALGVLLRSD